MLKASTPTPEMTCTIVKVAAKDPDGAGVGASVGSGKGVKVGSGVGVRDGKAEGTVDCVCEGTLVTTSMGFDVGPGVSSEGDGASEADPWLVVSKVGFWVGVDDARIGASEGDTLTDITEGAGSTEGFNVGFKVGEEEEEEEEEVLVGEVVVAAEGTLLGEETGDFENDDEDVVGFVCRRLYGNVRRWYGCFHGWR